MFFRLLLPSKGSTANTPSHQCQLSLTAGPPCTRCPQAALKALTATRAPIQFQRRQASSRTTHHPRQRLCRPGPPPPRIRRQRIHNCERYRSKVSGYQKRRMGEINNCFWSLLSTARRIWSAVEYIEPPKTSSSNLFLCIWKCNRNYQVFILSSASLAPLCRGYIKI